MSIPRKSLILKRIQTPKTPISNGENTSTRTPSAWTIARVRANIFTNEEWPTMMPQPRGFFSLGREQSLSTVVGLAWSPPGLGKYRRSVLAVLTSNMVLSFFETVGAQEKWTRVAVVNGVLSARGAKMTESEGERLCKASVSAFAWCPPLKVPEGEGGERTYARDGTETRWGVHLLTVVTEENEVILLQPRRTTAGYEIEVLDSAFVEDENLEHPQIQSGSLLSTMLKTQKKTLSMSCGPWFYRPGGQGVHAVPSATGNVAVLYGTTVKLVKLDVSLALDEDRQSSHPRLKITGDCQETTPDGWPDLYWYHCTGPLQWLYKVTILRTCQETMLTVHYRMALLIFVSSQALSVACF